MTPSYSYPYASIRLDVRGVEQLSINALHNMHDAPALLVWIHGEGVPELVIHAAIKTICPEGSRHWSDIYEDLLLGEERLAVLFSKDKAQGDLSFNEAKLLLSTHWQSCLHQYEEALKLTISPGLELSNNALALYGHLLREYIYRGDVHSGRFDAVHATLQLSWIGGTSIADAAILELERLALVQQVSPRAGRAGPSYELTYSARARLLMHFPLVEKYWTSSVFREQREQEIATVLANNPFFSLTPETRGNESADQEISQ